VKERPVGRSDDAGSLWCGVRWSNVGQFGAGICRTNDGINEIKSYKHLALSAGSEGCKRLSVLLLSLLLPPLLSDIANSG